MSQAKEHIILCNGAKLPQSSIKEQDVVQLEYNPNSPDINVNIPLPKFVESVYHLPKRVKDLLEIAAYVFTADRKIKRGTTDSVEYQSWSRNLRFIIKVRDHEFWSQDSVKEILAEALKFMTGDASYSFEFIDGFTTGKSNFFDKEEFTIKPSAPTRVILFSGGLDSLAGIVDSLETTRENIYLISHVSQPGILKTQRGLLTALERDYPGRCKHYTFTCNLKGDVAREETQRTRSLLYSAIAYAIAVAHSRESFYFYENGITSINFKKRGDLLNARASRTTHAKTIGLISDLLSKIHESHFKVEHPYLFNTKTDILEILAKHKKQNYINSSVSCSATRMKKQNATHCGGCSQCVDRRFATHAAGVEAYDGTAIYDLDFVNETVDDRPKKTTIIDYVRLARDFKKMNYRTFYSEKLSELSEIVDYIEGGDEEGKVEKIYQLCVKHGRQIEQAIKKMDQPFEEVVPGSFLDFLGKREFLKEHAERLADSISKKLSKAIPIAFSKNKPKNENDLNDKIHAILEGEREGYEREFPLTPFALAKVITDHSLNGYDLLIEAKYIRSNTTPSTASEGIAADLTKYPNDSHKLFIVYDPEAQITDRDKFIDDFEKKGNCTVTIIR
ncbi:MAG TPA: hypothetical protein VK042_02235 [Atopostipes sp.]|nr:hypothetical protein [Atopostipes sp.]